MAFKGTVMENCPFCGRQAISMNPQGISVCISHKDAYLELKCHCGSWLDILKGKYGTFCNCLKCGNMSMKKALELNDVMKPMPANNSGFSKTRDDEKPRNITVRSDDPRYFD